MTVLTTGLSSVLDLAEEPEEQHLVRPVVRLETGLVADSDPSAVPMPAAEARLGLHRNLPALRRLAVAAARRPRSSESSCLRL